MVFWQSDTNRYFPFWRRVGSATEDEFFTDISSKSQVNSNNVDSTGMKVDMHILIFWAFVK
ncbi:hypothetical protein CLW00_101595 [Mongoliibacter ruber]|uniref:Uncharacterized protein n=1 Tax=Mongoliibacter ruber TaxID=1750599 RepID=A0A2T0WW53_9BACT|nr:hypothetical protein CLW00_101595 [Mongoliibacter ruber]